MTVLVGKLLFLVEPYVIGLFGPLEPYHLKQFVQPLGKAHPYCICGFHNRKIRCGAVRRDDGKGGNHRSQQVGIPAPRRPPLYRRATTFGEGFTDYTRPSGNKEQSEQCRQIHQLFYENERQVGQIGRAHV